VRCGLLGERDKEAGVRPAGIVDFPECVQLFQPELADRREHPEARLAVRSFRLAQQVFLHERREEIQR
jgi:hypothetical protein